MKIYSSNVEAQQLRIDTGDGLLVVSVRKKRSGLDGWKRRGYEDYVFGLQK
jgi:hypothetical protein